MEVGELCDGVEEYWKGATMVLDMGTIDDLRIVVVERERMQVPTGLSNPRDGRVRYRVKVDTTQIAQCSEGWKNARIAGARSSSTASVQSKGTQDKSGWVEERS